MVPNHTLYHGVPVNRITAEQSKNTTTILQRVLVQVHMSARQHSKTWARIYVESGERSTPCDEPHAVCQLTSRLTHSAMKSAGMIGITLTDIGCN